MRMRHQKKAGRRGVWIPLLSLGLAGVGVMSWRVLRHLTIPVDATEFDMTFTTASPHLLDARVFQGTRPPQLIQDGIGPLYHRRYYVDIANPAMTKEALMAYIRENQNDFSPVEMAIFRKTHPEGENKPMQLGDEYMVRISGPWNGPVRVIDLTPTSYSYITLDTHLEAGEIQFRVIDHPERDDAIRFEIRSWTRSRDKLIDFFYDRVSLIKTAQARMWIYFCQHVAEASGGEMLDDVTMVTHRVPYHTVKQSLSAVEHRWQQYRPRIEYLRHVKPNYEAQPLETLREAGGWRFDEYAVELPPEEPGPPHPHGSWTQAKEVLLAYEFPDPSLISGIYVPDDPLRDRVMLLEARFLWLTFRFGVRVTRVIDEQRTDEIHGPAQVWGYSYQTLQGHFEQGEITFEVWKFLETGRVDFRIHAYSRTGHIANPFYRIGFAIFGRGLQKRFARTALARTVQMVNERLAGVQKTSLETPDVGSIEEADATE